MDSTKNNLLLSSPYILYLILLQAIISQTMVDMTAHDRRTTLLAIRLYHVIYTVLRSLYDRLYWTPSASSKQSVKDNEVVVSDWLPMSRMWHEKVSAWTFTFNEPIMYPKILKHGLPALRLEFMVLSSFIMYYRMFIRRLYANGYVSFRPKFWSTGS